MNVADTRPEAALAACGAQTIALSDERYPPLLRTIYDPPPLLYVRGDLSLLQEAQLAVVGSRRASPAGLRIAQSLSGQLANAGLHICSGLALGIDGAAHRCAVYMCGCLMCMCLSVCPCVCGGGGVCVCVGGGLSDIWPNNVAGRGVFSNIGT